MLTCALVIDFMLSNSQTNAVPALTRLWQYNAFLLATLSCRMTIGPDAPVAVDFSGRSSAAKRQWLESTALPVRRLVFHREGYTGALMLNGATQAHSAAPEAQARQVQGQGSE